MGSSKGNDESLSGGLVFSPIPKTGCSMLFCYTCLDRARPVSSQPKSSLMLCTAKSGSRANTGDDNMQVQDFSMLSFDSSSKAEKGMREKKSWQFMNSLSLSLFFSPELLCMQSGWCRFLLEAF